MPYPADQIIPITLRIAPSGLSYDNFGSAMLFAPQSELPQGFSPDKYRVYNSLPDLSVDFPSDKETYKAAERWLGGIPKARQLTVWGIADDDSSITDTLNKARNELWWFFSFFTKDKYADVSKAEEISAWCNSNGSWFQNCQTGTEADKIRDPSSDDNIAITLQAAGIRFSKTWTSKVDPYAGIALCKWFAAVNYNSVNSTITGEYKKLDGVTAESTTGTEQNAMLKETVNAGWYGTIDTQGSIDQGRCINTKSHSAYGEWMDDVINTAAAVNALQVDLYNTIANRPTKLPQNTAGQQALITAAQQWGERQISNGFLGERNYIDPDTGLERFTRGYEILTKPEDILVINDVQRANRESAVMRIRIYRAGAIQKCFVDLDVY